MVEEFGARLKVRLFFQFDVIVPPLGRVGGWVLRSLQRL